MANYADRLKEEYTSHREDEMELEQISGTKYADASSLDDALAGSALEHKKIIRKQKNRVDFICDCTCVLLHEWYSRRHCPLLCYPFVQIHF